jgi:hypothetical protein
MPALAGRAAGRASVSLPGRCAAPKLHLIRLTERAGPARPRQPDSAALPDARRILHHRHKRAEVASPASAAPHQRFGSPPARRRLPECSPSTSLAAKKEMCDVLGRGGHDRHYRRRLLLPPLNSLAAAAVPPDTRSCAASASDVRDESSWMVRRSNEPGWRMLAPGVDSACETRFAYPTPCSVSAERPDDSTSRQNPDSVRKHFDAIGPTGAGSWLHGGWSTAKSPIGTRSSISTPVSTSAPQTTTVRPRVERHPPGWCPTPAGAWARGDPGPARRGDTPTA